MSCESRVLRMCLLVAIGTIALTSCTSIGRMMGRVPRADTPQAQSSAPSVEAPTKGAPSQVSQDPSPTGTKPPGAVASNAPPDPASSQATMSRPAPAASSASGGGAVDPAPSVTAKATAVQPGAAAVSNFGSPAASNSFRIGEEDEVEVSVYGHPDLTKTQIVRPDGKVAVPLVGDVQASGVLPDDLRAEITQQLAKYVKDPAVTVIITKYNSKKISVLGEVRTPGLLRLSTDITLLEAISRAGGITENADLQGAMLLRAGRILPVNFERLMRAGDFSQNVVLSPNDVVLIPNITDKKAFILGEVRKPLVVALKPGTTLVELISRAGGVTEEADLSAALLLRDAQRVPVDFDKLLKGDASQNVLLRPNDLVLIPSITEKKAFVLGEVNKPSVVLLKFNTTLIESISRAGGVTQDADLTGSLLIRDGQVARVNFQNLLKGDLTQNVVLRGNDVILIPNVRDKKVFVLGEVTRPLVVSLRPGVTVVESISQAGGFTREAQPKSVVIVRGGLADPKLMTVNVNEITSKGQSAQNVLLEPGDIVYVPRSFVADVVQFFRDLNAILTPVVLAQTGIVLGPSVQSVLTTGRATTEQPIVVPTR